MSGTVRTDAERYRYLRDHCSTCGPNSNGVAFCVVFFTAQGDDLNAAIDAALEPVVPDEPDPIDVVSTHLVEISKAKGEAARRVILDALANAFCYAAPIDLLAASLDVAGVRMTLLDLMQVCLEMEREGLVLIERHYQRPAVLKLTESGRCWNG